MKVLFLILIIALLLTPYGCGTGGSQITLKDYPEIFSGYTHIITGDHPSLVEIVSAEIIQANLRDKNEHNRVFVRDSSCIKDKRILKDNIILVATPDSDDQLTELLDKAGISPITNEYPGASKGVLEIAPNPWDKSRVVLLVGGSDEHGLDAAIEMLDDANLANVSQLVMNWDGDPAIEFPIDSKAEAIRYAILDPDVRAYIDWLQQKEYGVGFGVYKSTDSLKWEVIIEADPNIVTDTWMGIHFLPDGTIVFKREGSV